MNQTKSSPRKRLMVNPRTGTMLQLPLPALQKGETQKAKQLFERSATGLITIPNKNITPGEPDFLYHLGLSSEMDLPSMFGDVKFVCMGGSATRAYNFANALAERLGLQIPAGMSLAPIGKTERYSMYKVGPVISINHGMGMPSLSILLHELFKLLAHAGASDVIWIRIGTSGGLGLTGGTVVVATEAMNGKLEGCFENLVLGQVRRYPTILDQHLAEFAFECAKGTEGSTNMKEKTIPCVIGKTMGTDDFYEGQGRLDGAFCEYTEAEKFEYLQKAYDAGIRNIEMESSLFAAFCNRAKQPGLLCNTVLLDRLKGDQVNSTPEELASFSLNAQEVAMRVIERRFAATTGDE